MNDYRYTLFNDHGRKKLTCPKCGVKKCFTPYVDTAGEIRLPADVGRCDRESKCGWHLTPKAYFEANPSARDQWSAPAPRKDVAPAPELPTLYMSHDLMLASLKGYERNNLFLFLASVMGADNTLKAFKRYNVGTANALGGSTVFWQVDFEGRVRTGNRVGGKHY